MEKKEERKILVCEYKDGVQVLSEYTEKEMAKKNKLDNKPSSRCWVAVLVLLGLLFIMLYLWIH
ncbi:hypothetical protein LJC31_04490 [Synergistaceae bacterium OttesenSCG-928-I11]|nr:hypothetical protein [Synergistaceae bacterium OttesenSCG-928-I11]